MLAKTSPSSNIFLFAGEDDFGMRRKITLWRNEFAKKYSADAIVLIDGENASEQDLTERLKQELSPSLFSAKKLIILRNGLPLEPILEMLDMVPRDFFLVFWQSKKLDRRTSFYKQLIKKVSITEFNLPHGRQLNSWIKSIAAELGAEIDEQAIEVLAVYLGRDLFDKDKEAFNLWQAYNELMKLVSFNRKITAENVSRLVSPKLPENVFALSDKIMAKDRQGAVKIFEELLSQSTSDEKTAIIKIVGLISEQLRSLILIDYLKKANLSQQEMADRLGWSPGRVFVILKHSAHTGHMRLKSLLSSLLSVDLMIKSTDQNPKLLLDLFIDQACS
ncbi:MAG: DNA polymerase III subunit delta [Candidatus Doudnabacteria bacterium]|nr:DNA polymerase III subunit delta [Candidatus Doudnabacteria bacterium]